jgi:large subunit ribosomal protein L22
MADEKKTKKQAAKKASDEQAAAKGTGGSPKAKKASAEKGAAAKRGAAAKSTTGKAKAAEKTAAKAEQPAGKAKRGRKADAKTEKSAAKKPAAKPAPIVVRASSRYVRVAPRKARLIADQVRGLHIDRARALLEFSPRDAARDIRKVIESAASNAENNHELIADEMRVAEITVDEGPTLRRYRPRAKGRASRINKRTSHIAVALSPEERV